jgi:hypothetical protein
MEFLVVLAVLALVALFVTRPLWRMAGPRREGRREPDQVAELEAARDAKYREIRDAELDRRTGKLSEQDFEAVDRALRAEAIEILRALDEARGSVNGHAERLPSPQR